MRLWLTLFGFIFCHSSVFTQVSISDSLKGKILVDDLSFLIDRSGHLNLDLVRELSFTDSNRLASSVLSEGHRSQAVWIKFGMQTSANLAEPIALRFPWYSYLQFYVVYPDKIDSASKGFLEIHSVEKRKFDAYAQLVHLTPEARITVFARLRSVINQSADHIQMDISAASESAANSAKLYDTHLKNGAYLSVAFCSFLLFQLIYIFFQWLFVRRSEYIYYGLYILCIFFYFYNRYCSYHSEIPEICFSGPIVMTAFNSILLILPSFFYFRFGRYFVDLKHQDPTLNKILKIAEWVILAAVLVTALLQLIPNSFQKNVLAYIVVIAQFMFSIFALKRIYNQHRTVAYFLTAGSACALLAHVAAMFLPLVVPNWFQHFNSPMITAVGLFLEIGIFNTGLLFKAKEAEAERIDAQEKYINELKSKQKLMEAYSEVRDKISSDLHDDIGSTLSSISIYSYAAKQNLQQGKLASLNQLLGNIERNTNLTLSAMSDLVWSVNPLNDTSEKLVERIQSFAYELLTAKNIYFSIFIDKNFYNFEITQEQRKNILLICKEALNNAAKYSQASEVKMTLVESDNNQYCCSISDNGIGIKNDQGQGNGLRTMKKRAEALGGSFLIKSESNGTTISFVIVLEKISTNS